MPARPSPATPSLTHAAIDARMIGHSGIGTVLRGLLHAWAAEPPPFRVRLLGEPDVLRERVPAGLAADIVPFRMRIYDLRHLVAAAPTQGAQVFFTPQYTLPMRTPVPSVAMIHDLLHITHPPRPGTAPFMRASLARLRRRVRYVVTPSRHTKVQLQTLHGFYAARVLTLLPGPGVLDLAEREALGPEALGPRAQEEGGYLLAVGIWKPHKNWRALLEALAPLWREGRMRWPLEAAGLDEAGRAAIAKEARRLGVEDWIHVVPRLRDGQMAALYQGAVGLPFPSVAEGFGLPIVEAMGAGVPVLCADLAPMSEVAGGAALLFDPESPESLTRGLLALVEDGPERAARIAAGRARAEQFSWGRFARELEDVLRRAAAEAGQGVDDGPEV